MTSFARRLTDARLDEIRKKYSLPERFLLYAGAIDPPKNFTRLVRAYAQVGPGRGIPLVVAGGENRFLSEQELKEPDVLGIAGGSVTARLCRQGGASRIVRWRRRVPLSGDL